MSTVKITDDFWGRYIKLIKDEMIPFQWDVLNDNRDIIIQKERNEEGIPADKSNAIENLKIAAGKSEGDHYGWWFQDTDVYKWLESVAYSLKHEPDKDLEDIADTAIDLIGEAQEEDGYLNTFYQIKSPQLKFRRLLESHELYGAGHLIEAAIAYYEVTQKDKLLKIACKFADCIHRHFGPEAGKIHGADGHQEIELALVKLYVCTKEEKYLLLSDYFLAIRGKDPEFYKKQLIENIEKGYSEGPISNIHLEYMQAHKPPVEQSLAVGHAVRMGYMCTGMAEVAYYTGNEKLKAACQKIWKNIVQRRMYVTGGIGSTAHGEAFTLDYDLPNDTMYCETCAAISLMYFAYSMLKLESDSQYADILERALYNNVISGMSLDGKKYFYANPLESHPETNLHNPGKGHVKSTRPDWFGCACCPPNLARTISSIDKYIYTSNGEAIYTHLYLNHTIEMSGLSVKQQIKYDNKAYITIQITADKPIQKALYFRIPSWSQEYKVYLNNERLEHVPLQRGYLKLEKEWHETEEIKIQLELPVLQLMAHPKVRVNIGKRCIQRGPFIYCLEEADNGPDLSCIYLTDETQFSVKQSAELGGIPILEGNGETLQITDRWTNNLYQYAVEPVYKPTKITLIPYYAWSNRSIGEMQVWINKK